MGFTRTSLVVLTAAVILNVLPSFLVPALPKISEGFAAPGWHKVEQLFKSQVESGLETGGGFAVWYKGQLVFDYVGGYADDVARRPYTRDILTLTYSCTKGVSAITTALLVERGLLDYDKPVVKYWPEFGQNGKEEVTVRMLLAHTAGLAALDEQLDINDIVKNPEKVSKALARQKPSWKPGTAIGYHAYTAGMYMNELIKRIDPKHRTLAQFFNEEIAIPFDIDMFIGLPRELYYRTSPIYSASLWIAIETGHWSLIPILFKMAFGINTEGVMKTMNNPSGLDLFNVNTPEMRDIPLGSTHGHATAASLAKIYGILANGGSYKGKKLLSEKTIRDLIKPVTSGVDVYWEYNITFAAAVNILPNDQGESVFGTSGAGGQMGIGDLNHHLGWAYVSNHMKNSRPFQDPRFTRLLEAVYEKIKELEGK